MLLRLYFAFQFIYESANHLASLSLLSSDRATVISVMLCNDD